MTAKILAKRCVEAGLPIPVEVRERDDMHNAWVSFRLNADGKTQPVGIFIDHKNRFSVQYCKGGSISPWTPDLNQAIQMAKEALV